LGNLAAEGIIVRQDPRKIPLDRNGHQPEHIFTAWRFWHPVQYYHRGYFIGICGYKVFNLRKRLKIEEIWQPDEMHLCPKCFPDEVAF